MKLKTIVSATIISVLSCIPISLPTSAQDIGEFYGVDNSDNLINLEQLKADSLVQSAEEKLALGSLSEKKSALKDVEKALDIYKNLGSQLDNTGYNRIESTLDILCRKYDEIKDWTNTIKYCQEQASIEKKRGGLEGASRHLANAYVATKDYNAAIDVLQVGLDATKNQFNDPNYCLESQQLCESRKGNAIILYLERLGEIHFIAKNYDESAKYYQEVIDVNNQIRDSESPEDKTNLGYALLRAGNITEAERELLTALRNKEAEIKKYNESQNILSQQWNVPSLQLEQNILGRSNLIDKKVYYALQELKVQQGKYQEALNFSQKVKSGGLSAFLSNQEDSQALDTITVEQIKNVAQEQQATLIEYSLIEEDKLFIWVISPNGQINFRQVDLTSPPAKNTSTTISILQKIAILAIGVPSSLLLLRRKKYILWLGIGATIIAAFLLPLNQQKIASNSRDASSAPSDSTNFSLSNLTQATFVSLSGKDRGVLSESLDKADCKNNEDCLKQLYQLLIEPIAEFLPQNPEEQIIFIPQGELFRVPFAALKDSKNKYLIEKHTIRTAPSIEMLKLNYEQAKQNSSNTFTQALVVGNPIMPEVQVEVSKPATQLSSLPATEEEAKAIAKLLDTNPLIGEQATESNVINQMTNAKLIHLATHGVLSVKKVRHFNCSLITHGSRYDSYYVPPQDEYEYETSSYDLYDKLLCNMLSGREDAGVDVLALTPSGEDDGLFNEIEIYKQDLNAELVVLSACDTGLGKINSDGVVGLARPFLTKGVPSVVVSLWQIPDAETKDLMVDFYTNLKNNPDKAQALRQAMLTTKDKYPEPEKWAAFTLVGEK